MPTLGHRHAAAPHPWGGHQQQQQQQQQQYQQQQQQYHHQQQYQQQHHHHQQQQQRRRRPHPPPQSQYPQSHPQRQAGVVAATGAPCFVLVALPQSQGGGVRGGQVYWPAYLFETGGDLSRAIRTRRGTLGAAGADRIVAHRQWGRLKGGGGARLRPALLLGRPPASGSGCGSGSATAVAAVAVPHAGLPAGPGGGGGGGQRPLLPPVVGFWGCRDELVQAYVHREIAGAGGPEAAGPAAAAAAGSPLTPALVAEWVQALALAEAALCEDGHRRPPSASPPPTAGRVMVPPPSLRSAPSSARSSASLPHRGRMPRLHISQFPSASKAGRAATDDEEEGVLTMDASGAYTLPSPCVPGGGGSNIISGHNTKSNDDNGDEDDDEEEEESSPHRPKAIDFGRVAAPVNESEPEPGATSRDRAVSFGDAPVGGGAGSEPEPEPEPEAVGPNDREQEEGKEQGREAGRGGIRAPPSRAPLAAGVGPGPESDVSDDDDDDSDFGKVLSPADSVPGTPSSGTPRMGRKFTPTHRRVRSTAVHLGGQSVRDWALKESPAAPGGSGPEVATDEAMEKDQEDEDEDVVEEEQEDEKEGEAPPPVSPAAPTPIMKDQTAWRILMDRKKFKFRYTGGFHCLPGVSPKSPGAIEGRDYFKTLAALRRFLCAFGVPINDEHRQGTDGGGGGRARGRRASEKRTAEDVLSDDELYELSLWIRSAVVESMKPALGGQRFLPVFSGPALDDLTAWRLLERLGYSYAGGTYRLPGAAMKSTAKGGILAPGHFESWDTLFEHIARFGIEHGSGKTLDDNEQLKLERFAANCRTRYDAFEWNTPNDQDFDWLYPNNASVSATIATEEDENKECADESERPPSEVIIQEPSKNLTKTENFSGSDTSRPVEDVFHDSLITQPEHDEIAERPQTIEPDSDRSTPSPKAAAAIDTSKSLLTPARSFLLFSKDKQGLTPQVKNAVKSNKEHQGKELKDIAGKTLSIGSPIERDENWTVVYGKLKGAGWKHTVGNGLHAFNYVLPGCKTRSEGGIEGTDYLTEEMDVKLFAMKQFGWGGDAESRQHEISNGGRARRKRSSSSSSSLTRQEKEQVPKKKKSKLRLVKKTPTPKSARDSESAAKARPPPSKPSPVDKASTREQSGTEDGRQGGDRRSCPVESTSPSATKVAGAAPFAPTGSIPDNQTTVEEKLRCCQSVLHSEEVQISMSMTSSRLEKHVKEIHSFLDDVINPCLGVTEAGSETKSNGSSLYVCGAPGTGKTTTLNRCIEAFSEESGARFLFLNVTSCGADASTAAGTILKEIGAELRVKSPSLDRIGKRLTPSSPGKGGRAGRYSPPLVLVLDEIDVLISPGSGKNAEGNRLISHLLRWASAPSCSFALLGISNSVDNAHSRKLRELGEVSRTVVFTPYSETDLLAIVQDRVGIKIIAEKALQLVCRKVAAASGDARSALDMTAKAVRKCEESLAADQLGRSGEGEGGIEYPLVKLPHMMRSLREGMAMKHSETIEGLPQACKIVLCVAITLSSVSPAYKVIRMKDLRKYCAEASRHGLLENLSIDILFDIVSMLTDSGLLLVGDDSQAGASDLRQWVYTGDLFEAPLQLGCQLDDVECALEKTLMSERFYRQLGEYVRKHHGSW